jgi:hypothetical protein
MTLSMLEYVQYVKKLFETNKGNFAGSKPIIGRTITFNPEKIVAFGLEQFFYILYNKNFQKIFKLLFFCSPGLNPMNPYESLFKCFHQGSQMLLVS